MRVFWAVIGVLVLVTGGLFALRARGGGVADAAPSGQSATPTAEQASDAVVGAAESATEMSSPPVQTADPEITEVESVEAGLAEAGIVVVEEAAPEASAPEVEASASDGDTRDGAQVVLDAIVAQRGDDVDGEPAATKENSVESDWLVSTSDASAAPEAPTPETPTSDDGDSADEAAADESAADEGSVEPAADEGATSETPAVDAATSGPDKGEIETTEATTPAGNSDGIGGGLGAIGDLVNKSAAKAPPGPEGTVERREDGSLLVNGSVVVKGKGTEEAPYELPWDLLVSAGRSYAPEKGRKVLPAWTREVQGKWVRLRGYLLISVMASDTDELVVMLNQWDGCCIGVPPTPYDAAEVKLRKSVESYVGGRGFVDYGTIKGKMDVDPFISGGWLMGLYVIKEGEIETGSGTKGT
ncbi:MAG: hypothetical protein R3B57_06860 [Phycisphaerales bacterium]